MQSSTTPSSDAQTADLNPAEICTLSPEGLGDRLAWVRKEILPHAVEKVRLGNGLALELVEAPGLTEKIDHLIALERECCSGIVFERHASTTEGQVRLEVRGIDPDAQVFQAFGVPESNPPAGTRLAKAAGAEVAVPSDRERQPRTSARTAERSSCRDDEAVSPRTW